MLKMKKITGLSLKKVLKYKLHVEPNLLIR